jgi:bacteriorhodopsin
VHFDHLFLLSSILFLSEWNSTEHFGQDLFLGLEEVQEGVEAQEGVEEVVQTYFSKYIDWILFI